MEGREMYSKQSFKSFENYVELVVGDSDEDAQAMKV
jgi:hypothetical protein